MVSSRQYSYFKFSFARGIELKNCLSRVLFPLLSVVSSKSVHICICPTVDRPWWLAFIEDGLPTGRLANTLALGGHPVHLVWSQTDIAPACPPELQSCEVLLVLLERMTSVCPSCLPPVNHANTPGKADSAHQLDIVSIWPRLPRPTWK